MWVEISVTVFTILTIFEARSQTTTISTAYLLLLPDLHDARCPEYHMPTNEPYPTTQLRKMTVVASHVTRFIRGDLVGLTYTRILHAVDGFRVTQFLS